jgi:chromosome segregation ATPase
MSGWARRDRSKYRSASPAPFGDLAHEMHAKASTSTSKRLEKGINLLEEALAKCDTDDTYKSTLELYASHIQTQRADIAALRAELERAKKPVIDYRNQISVLETNLAEKEEECVALRSRVKELEARVKSNEKSIDACCSQLLEEREWRKTAMQCLHDELSLAKDTAGLVSSVQKKKNTPVDSNKSKNKFSQLTNRNLEKNAAAERKNRPNSAPPQHLSENTSEESLVDETEELAEDCGHSDGDGDTVLERRPRGKGREKEWSVDITSVSAVLSKIKNLN